MAQPPNDPHSSVPNSADGTTSQGSDAGPAPEAAPSNQSADYSSYSQPGAGYPGQGQQGSPGQPGTYQAAPGQPGSPGAPYGYDPVTALPYSEKSKLVAGLLGILLGGLGVGRFYTGHVGIGVAQLIVTFVTLGFGSLWGFIDGIIMLAGNAKDSNGLPLRPN